ncbi:NTP transferase domain-containing protein [Candidatus Woesearchaeota archaeon]|nr:NTP transferase domain-containing protein [Candidatus Woesearchaeota archaeon]
MNPEINALVLAGGYGTRLSASLESYHGEHQIFLQQSVVGKPKGLISIRGKALLDYHLEQAQSVGVSLENFHILSNATFYDQFRAWAKSKNIPPENVFNNDVTNNEGRNEQNKELILSVQRLGIRKPLLLFYSDTLVFDEHGLADLSSLVKGYALDGHSRVVVYHKTKEAYNHGVVEFDNQRNLISFREKPKGVNEGWVNASVYLFSPATLKELLARAGEFPSKGNPLEILWPRFKAFRVSHRLDIGTIEDVLKGNGLI